MKANFFGNVPDFDGEVLLPVVENGVQVGVKPVSIMRAMLDALGQNANEPSGIDQLEHLKRQRLGHKIYDSASKGEPTELTAEEVVLLKNKVAAHFKTFLAGPLLEILVAAETEDKPKLKSV